MRDKYDYLFHSLAFSFHVLDLLSEFDEPTQELMKLRANGMAYQPASVIVREKFGKKYTPAWCRSQDAKVLRFLERRLLPPERPEAI
jgi:hypothetical protein